MRMVCCPFQTSRIRGYCVLVWHSLILNYNLEKVQRQKEGERRDHLYSKTLYRLCIVLILVSLILCKASHQMSTLIMYGTTSVKNYQTVEVNVFNVICIRTEGYGQ